MIQLSRVGDWKKSIDAISSLISEGSFEFGKKLVRFQAVDPSQVAFVDFRMPASSFEKYSVPDEAKVSLDVVEFAKVISRASQDDRLVMEFDGTDFVVRLEGGQLSRKFKLPMMDLGDSSVSEPKIDFTTTVELKSKILKEVLKDASLFSSSVLIRVKDAKMVIEAQGSQGHLKTVITKGPGVKIDSSEEVLAKYSLNFLNNLLKEADPEQNVKLFLKTESALKAQYQIGDAEITFYLAHMML